MNEIITRTSCPVCSESMIRPVLSCMDHTLSRKDFEIWQCDHCELRFTQDAPNQEAMGPYYQSVNYISHSETDVGFINRLYKIARNYTLHWKMKLVRRQTGKEHSPGSLLDIGAGTGAFVQEVIAAKWAARGLEPDEGARKVGYEKYRVQLDSPEILFNLPPHSFDAVTMWHVLEHVHQLHEYIRAIRRILKREGVAFIALPNYTSEDATHYGANWAAYDVPRHLYHFAPASVRNLVGQHKMKVDAVIPMWLDAYYIAMLSEQYKKGKNAMIPAMVSGMKSNWHALRKKETCSSLVYIIRME